MPDPALAACSLLGSKIKPAALSPLSEAMTGYPPALALSAAEPNRSLGRHTGDGSDWTQKVARSLIHE